MNNYKLIQAAKERAIDRSGYTHTWEPRDVASKVEMPSGREIYKDGFSDYHGPSENDRPPN